MPPEPHELPALFIHPGESLDTLSRTLTIVQRKKGHRATSDDVLLAWAAGRACPSARRVLDLGSGKGTVALLLLRGLPDCVAVGVEALPQSHGLALRNARINGLSHRYDPRLGDLRDPSVLEGEPLFDLVCGAPPFMPLGTGTLPKDGQRAAGRFEMRGGIEDYAAEGGRRVTPQGRVVLLMDGNGRRRAERALEEAGLSPIRITGVHPYPGRAATYWIFESSPRLSDRPPVQEESFSLRIQPNGEWTPQYTAIRRALDLP